MLVNAMMQIDVGRFLSSSRDYATGLSRVIEGSEGFRGFEWEFQVEEV